MRRERVLAWLPLLGIAICSTGMLLLRGSTRCTFLSWFCNEHSMLLDLVTMTTVLLVPLLVLLGVGVRAGVHQFRRTRQMLHQVRALPRGALPEAVRVLAQQLEIADQLDVVDDAGNEAFCYGFLRPRICLTTGLIAMLSTVELEAVLRHERHHLRRRDPLRALLWTVCDATCVWTDVGGEQARLWRELAADRAVIAAGKRQALASALLKLVTHPQRGDDPHQALAISRLSVTEARIDHLLQPTDTAFPRVAWSRWLVFPAATVGATLLCAVLMAHL